MSSPDLLPLGEIEFRYARCRRLLRTLAPDAGGMLVTSRLGIYYLTGTLGWGLVWLPVEGELVLLLRKGVERAQLESPCATFFPSSHIRKSPLSALGAGVRFLPPLPWIKTDSTGRWRKCCKAVWKVCGSPPVMPSLLRPEP